MSDDRSQKGIGEYEQGFVRRMAHRMVGRAGITPSDVDDIQQSLLLKLIKAIPAFDPSRGSWPVYVATVVVRTAANMLRDQRAEKRDRRRVCSFSLIVEYDEGGPVTLGDTVTEREDNARRGRSPRGRQEMEELLMDLATVLAQASAGDRELLQRLLRDTNVSQVAPDTGIPHSTLSDAIRRMRKRLENTGLRDYLA